VLGLDEETQNSPPLVKLPDLSFYEDLVKQGFWKPTPAVTAVNHPCFSTDPEKFDGAGVAGFGETIVKALSSSSAWFSMFGGGEGQKLYVFAPDMGLAVWLRFGD